MIQERRFGGHGVCVHPIYCFFIVRTVKRKQRSDVKELMPGISFNLAWSMRENAPVLKAYGLRIAALTKFSRCDEVEEVAVEVHSCRRMWLGTVFSQVLQVVEGPLSTDMSLCRFNMEFGMVFEGAMLERAPTKDERYPKKALDKFQSMYVSLEI